MKHLAAIQVEFLKEAANWDDLSPESQRKYLRRHPKSKRRLKVKSRESEQTEDVDSIVADVKKMKVKKLGPEAYDKIARKWGSGWIDEHWTTFAKALKKEGIDIDLD